MEIVEKAPAKINLGLDVVGKREDGFHELEMVMLSLDLSDYITVKSIPENTIRLSTNGSFLPTDRRNHVYQAAEKIKKKYNISTGVELYIEKNIPVSAGLAGGSSDCAATLRALNKLWNLNASLEELEAIGAEIGSDVPYCIHGTCAFVTGRGEFVETLKPATNFYVILVKPHMSVSTASVFKALNWEEANHPNVRGVKDAILEGDFEKMIANMGNTLEDVTIERHKIIQKIKNSMEKYGADATLMSGSGPTVFCIVKKESKAKRIYNALKGFNKEVFLTRPIRGIEE